MKATKRRKFLAAALSAALCVSLVSAPVLAAGTTAGAGAAPSGQAGGTPPSGDPGRKGLSPDFSAPKIAELIVTPVNFIPTLFHHLPLLIETLVPGHQPRHGSRI